MESGFGRIWEASMFRKTKWQILINMIFVVWGRSVRNDYSTNQEIHKGTQLMTVTWQSVLFFLPPNICPLIQVKASKILWLLWDDDIISITLNLFDILVFKAVGHKWFNQIKWKLIDLGIPLMSDDVIL